MKAVTLLSGGLDSTTLAFHLHEEERIGWSDMIALSFDYGQRHGMREITAAVAIAKQFGIEHHVVFLGVENPDQPTGAPLGSILGGALTDLSVPVPDGHYAEDTMKATIVPNRNAIMLSIAYGVAVARGAELVAFAAHAGDHAIYPDCRPDFVEALDHALRLGNAWGTSLRGEGIPEIKGPFLFWDKARIAAEASKLGVPIAQTWSCYKGGEHHCGTCGTCYERREAFELAGVVDTTYYLDNSTRYSAPKG